MGGERERDSLNISLIDESFVDLQGVYIGYQRIIIRWDLFECVCGGGGGGWGGVIMNRH